MGGEVLPLVMEVYGWLSWATSGSTRGLRKPRFDAVLPWRDGGNQEVPLGDWMACEDQERVLWAVIWAGWPDRGPTWLALLEGGTLLRVTDTEANNWLPRALRTALTHWGYRPRIPLPPQPQPTTQAVGQMTATPSRDGPAPSRPGPRPQTTDTGGWELTNGPGHPPQQAQAPRP